MSLTHNDVFPAPKPPKPPRRSTGEAAVLKACLAYLHGLGVFCWRNNTGAFALSGGGYITFGLRGSADILGLIHGRFLAVECKSAIGRQSADQREFQRRVEAHNGVYLLVRSVSDLQTGIEKNFHFCKFNT